MSRTSTFVFIFSLVALSLTLSRNVQAQVGPPVFRSPADAGRTHRYRPNLIRYNEAWAIGTVRMFVAAQAVYQATNGNGNYGTLDELNQASLITAGLVQGRHGYVFRVRVEKLSSESPSSYEVVAVPRKYGITGRRSFYVNETGAIVAADRKGSEAHAGDDPLDLSRSVNIIQAQTGPPAGSPADAGSTNRPGPNLIRYNEAWAVRTVYTFVGAQAVYAATVGKGSYGTVAELSQEGLFSSALIKGRHGYLFSVRVKKFSPESLSSYEVIAVPRRYSRTGKRSFYVNQTGTIVAADRKGAEAIAGDDPLDP